MCGRSQTAECGSQRSLAALAQAHDRLISDVGHHQPAPAKLPDPHIDIEVELGRPEPQLHSADSAP